MRPSTLLLCLALALPTAALAEKPQAAQTTIKVQDYDANLHTVAHAYAGFIAHIFALKTGELGIDPKQDQDIFDEITATMSNDRAIRMLTELIEPVTRKTLKPKIAAQWAAYVQTTVWRKRVGTEMAAEKILKDTPSLTPEEARQEAAFNKSEAGKLRGKFAEQMMEVMHAKGPTLIFDIIELPTGFLDGTLPQVLQAVAAGTETVDTKDPLSQAVFEDLSKVRKATEREHKLLADFAQTRDATPLGTRNGIDADRKSLDQIEQANQAYKQQISEVMASLDSRSRDGARYTVGSRYFLRQMARTAANDRDFVTLVEQTQKLIDTRRQVDTLAEQNLGKSQISDKQLKLTDPAAQSKLEALLAAENEAQGKIKPILAGKR